MKLSNNNINIQRKMIMNVTKEMALGKNYLIFVDGLVVENDALLLYCKSTAEGRDYYIRLAEAYICENDNNFNFKHGYISLNNSFIKAVKECMAIGDSDIAMVVAKFKDDVRLHGCTYIPTVMSKSYSDRLEIGFNRDVFINDMSRFFSIITKEEYEEGISKGYEESKKQNIQMILNAASLMSGD